MLIFKSSRYKRETTESIIGIFSFLFFGNSPLFPAKQQRKPTQKMRLNERNVNLFTYCRASDSNFNEVK